MGDVPHSHCPYGCEHPQPFRGTDTRTEASLARGEVEWCGRCWVQDGEAVQMIPCTPEACADATV